MTEVPVRLKPGDVVGSLNVTASDENALLLSGSWLVAFCWLFLMLFTLAWIAGVCAYCYQSKTAPDPHAGILILFLIVTVAMAYHYAGLRIHVDRRRRELRKQRLLNVFLKALPATTFRAVQLELRDAGRGNIDIYNLQLQLVDGVSFFHITESRIDRKHSGHLVLAGMQVAERLGLPIEVVGRPKKKASAGLVEALALLDRTASPANPSDRAD